MSHPLLLTRYLYPAAVVYLLQNSLKCSVMLLLLTEANVIEVFIYVNSPDSPSSEDS